GRACWAATEWFEDFLKQVGWNSRPCIGDLNAQGIQNTAARDTDLSARWREFHRVRKKIRKYLRQPGAIRHKERRLAGEDLIEMQIFQLDGRPHSLQRVAQDGFDVAGREFRLGLS